MPFKPGQTGNPGGRPKGVRELSDRIRAATDGGGDLVLLLLDIATNDVEQTKDRLAAIKVLLERMLGQPMAVTDEATQRRRDLKLFLEALRLTPEQLARARELGALPPQTDQAAGAEVVVSGTPMSPLLKPLFSNS